MKKEHFEVLLEEINSRVKCIAESVSGLNDKITILDERVSGLDEKVSNLDIKVSVLQVQFTELNGKFTVLQNRVSGLEGAMQYFYDKLNTKIDGLGKRLTDSIDTAMKRIENHELRICRIEQMN